MSPALEAALVLFSQIAVVVLAVILIATSDGEGCTPGPYCEDCPSHAAKTANNKAATGRET